MPYGRRGYYRARRYVVRPRRYSMKRRPYRKSYYGRRRFFRRLPIRKVNWYGKLYNFKEKFLYTQMHITNTAPVNAGFALKATDLPQWSNRHVNFDQYKIYKWKITIVPPPLVQNLTQSTVSGYVGMESMTHYLGYDYTDATAPSTPSSMMGPSCIHAPWTHPLKMIITPRILKQAYESSIDTGYMPGRSWIDCDDDGVPHYGFKYLMDISSWGLQANQPELNLQVYYTVYYGFKNINRPGNT